MAAADHALFVQCSSINWTAQSSASCQGQLQTEARASRASVSRSCRTPAAALLHLQITLWTGARHAHRLLMRRVQLSSCRHHTAGPRCKLGRSCRVALRRCCCTWVCRLPAVLRGAISCARADSLGGHCLSGSQAACGQALCPSHTLIVSGESLQEPATPACKYCDSSV
jgi:hypothetical protein